MKTKNKVLIGGFILVGWFLWFQIRPSLIRRICFERVKKEIDEPGELYAKQADNIYRLCLIKWGMKAESVVNE